MLSISNQSTLQMVLYERHQNLHTMHIEIIYQVCLPNSGDNLRRPLNITVFFKFLNRQDQGCIVARNQRVGMQGEVVFEKTHIGIWSREEVVVVAGFCGRWGKMRRRRRRQEAKSFAAHWVSQGSVRTKIEQLVSTLLLNCPLFHFCSWFKLKDKQVCSFIRPSYFFDWVAAANFKLFFFGSLKKSSVPLGVAEIKQKTSNIAGNYKGAPQMCKGTRKHDSVGPGPPQHGG